MSVHIATLFDKNYLIRALAMRDSVLKFYPDANFWFLCLDDESENLINKIGLSQTKATNIGDFGDAELLGTRESRSRAEFAFTAKSAWLNHIANSESINNGDVLMWVDADILFYSSPTSMFDVMEKYSIAITPHKFTNKSEEMEKKVGKYNAGLILFKINSNSIKCLSEWRKECIDWCFLRYENGKLGDQMYLNSWMTKYQGVYELPDKGVNLGSWNIRNYKLQTRDSGRILVDSAPLVCYHFHGVNMYLENNLVFPLPISILNGKIFEIYASSIGKAFKLALLADKTWTYGFIKKPNSLRLMKQKIQRYLRRIGENLKL
jgi:hypothetical protein